MKNSHQHWRALTLSIPVCGKSDPWVANRNWTQISEDLAQLLPANSGVEGGISGQTTDENGVVKELAAHFQYEDLPRAVHAFRSIWIHAGFPDRTRLNHVERFPDCTINHHVMIRWIDGAMNPLSFALTDDVRLGPHNA